VRLKKKKRWSDVCHLRKLQVYNVLADHSSEETLSGKEICESGLGIGKGADDAPKKARER